MKLLASVVMVLLLAVGALAIHSPETQTLYDKEFFSIGPSRDQVQRILDIRSMNLDYTDLTTPAFAGAQRILDPRYRLKYGYNLESGLPELGSPYDEQMLYVLREERMMMASAPAKVFGLQRYPENVVRKREAGNTLASEYRARLQQKRVETQARWASIYLARPRWYAGNAQQSLQAEDLSDPRARSRITFANPY